MWCFMLVMGSNYHYCVEPGKVCAELIEGCPLSLHWPSCNCSSENTLCKGLESSEAITSKAHVAGRPLCSVSGLRTDREVHCLLCVMARYPALLVYPMGALCDTLMVLVSALWPETSVLCPVKQEQH